MLNTLKTYFGYDNFRHGQQDLVTSILHGDDTLGIMPTGAGKSICFQLPALMLDGITLVISPLISLMKDQVMSLIQAKIPCAYINSSLSPIQMNKVIQNAKNGEYKLIYVAPERLESEDFLDFATSVDISMITVDEAHCISQWGQDFRPSYTQIPNFIEKLGKRPIISAFTATATMRVREDIINLLQLRSPLVLVTGFDRENLFYSVENTTDKLGSLLKFLQTQDEDSSGIVYCISRKNVEEVCEILCDKGYAATRYHAGLSDKERAQNQEDFLFDKSKIMVATNAFGMGIDKANVSFVVHFNMPKDIESYYQEAGRAGRDGSNAQCLLLYSARDVRTNEFMIKNPKDRIEDLQEFIIEQDLLRLKQMTFYSTTNECLRAFILKYFGENPENFCGKCSNCTTNFETVDITIVAQKILSCVKRMGERFGISLVIDVLRGSKNKRIEMLGFDKLSTYAIIDDMSARTVMNICDFLLQNDYLRKTDDEYPVVKLGINAKSVLKKDAYLEMKLAKDKPKQEKSKLSSKKKALFKEIPEDRTDLYEVLREVRRKLAAEEGVPNFYVFSDKTLVDMCNKCPTNDEQFLEVNGVGKGKLEKFGEEFTGAIRDYLDTKDL